MFHAAVQKKSEAGPCAGGGGGGCHAEADEGQRESGHHADGSHPHRYPPSRSDGGQGRRRCRPDHVPYFGCGVRRRYGLRVFQPFGNLALASSSLTAGTMITSSPCFQFTGVATLWASVSWSESITRKISSKFRPVVCGYVIIRRIFFLGSMTNTVRTVYTSSCDGCIMP